MMNKQYMQEMIIAVILLLVSLAFVNPFQLWMPNTMTMMLLLVLLILVGLFAGFVWRERGGDEREKIHRTRADRLGFLFGLLVVVAGIAVTALQHETNTWLVIVLIVMVLTKVISLIHNQIRY